MLKLPLDTLQLGSRYLTLLTFEVAFHPRYITGVIAFLFICILNKIAKKGLAAIYLHVHGQSGIALVVGEHHSFFEVYFDKIIFIELFHCFANIAWQIFFLDLDLFLKHKLSKNVEVILADPVSICWLVLV